MWTLFALYMFQISGERLDTLVAALDGAVGGVAVDKTGFIYVADFRNKVWRITPEGEVEVFADYLYGASGNHIDAQGRLLQSNFFGNTLTRINRDGSHETLTTELNGPVGVTELDDSDIAICNCSGNEVVRLDKQRKLEVIADGDLFNCPNGLNKGPDGTLYVANFSDGRVIKIDSQGQAHLVGVVPGGGNGHLVLVGDTLYVTGFRSNRLYRLGLDGTVTIAEGSGQFGVVDGSGDQAQFASPNGIAWNPTRDELYINDYLVPFTHRTRTKPQSALRRVVFPTLTEAFQQADQQSGIEAAIKAHRKYKQSRTGKFTEIETNMLGYTLLQSGRAADAIRVFQCNTEDYPNSFNTWDSLAEGYMVAGDKANAVKYYRKSLALNPNNQNAVDRLKKLESSP